MTGLADFFSLFSIPRKYHFHNSNSFHMVVRSSGVTYLVPHSRQCISEPLNNSVPPFTTCLLNVATDTVKFHKIIFYLSNTV